MSPTKHSEAYDMDYVRLCVFFAGVAVMLLLTHTEPAVW